MLYPLFGSPYQGYLKAPSWKVQRHITRWLAKKQADSEDADKQWEKQQELDALRDAQ